MGVPSLCHPAGLLATLVLLGEWLRVSSMRVPLASFAASLVTACCASTGEGVAGRPRPRMPSSGQQVHRCPLELTGRRPG